MGGGFIGLEMAEELTNSGLEVHLFEVMPRLLPFLEERFSAAVLDVLQKHGVYVHLNAEVAALETADGHVCGVQTKDGAQIPVNNVLLSIGVRRPASWQRTPGWSWGSRTASSWTTRCAPATPISGPAATVCR